MNITEHYQHLKRNLFAQPKVAETVINSNPFLRDLYLKLIKQGIPFEAKFSDNWINDNYKEILK